MPRRTLVTVLLTALAVILPGVSPAQADIAFSQQVVLRHDKSPIVLKYSSFADGTGSCQDCASMFKTAGGKLHLAIRTYKLKEQARKDYYLVDVTARTTNRHGNEDWAYMEAKLQSTKKVDFATHSSGKKETKEDCHVYPLNIGASFHGISAGTKVAEFSTCTKSWISSKRATRGRLYHVTNLNGVRRVGFQRFVRVAHGAHPVFKVSITRPTDNCKVYTWSDGQHYFCYNVNTTTHYKIGTKR